MLRQLSATEFQELMIFFRVKQEQREEAQAIANERNLRQWFDRKIAVQKKENEDA